MAHSRDGNYLAEKYDEYPDWALIMITDKHAVFCDFLDRFSCSTTPERLIDYYKGHKDSSIADIVKLGRDYLRPRETLLDIVITRIVDLGTLPPPFDAMTAEQLKAAILALAPETAPDPPSEE